MESKRRGYEQLLRNPATNGWMEENKQTKEVEKNDHRRIKEAIVLTEIKERTFQKGWAKYANAAESSCDTISLPLPVGLC